MEFTYTQSEISEIAAQILTAAPSNIFLLYGEMGVGKTTLIKEMVKQLGVPEAMGSPTFSIVNEYETDEGLIFHFDFYRISDIAEAYDLGMEDYISTGKYLFIEWPEKILGLLPPKFNKIVISKNNNGSRILKFMPMK